MLIGTFLSGDEFCGEISNCHGDCSESVQGNLSLPGVLIIMCEIMITLCIKQTLHEATLLPAAVLGNKINID